jgi:nucleoside-diphosphate-sugar epimerase
MIRMVRKRWLPVVRGDAGRLPLIHIDDAVNATVRALDHGPAGRTYEIVDDRPASMSEVVETLAEYTGSRRPLRVPAWLPRLIAPYMSRVGSFRTPLSNEAAKAELGWRLRYPTMREGLEELMRRAA